MIWFACYILTIAAANAAIAAFGLVPLVLPDGAGPAWCLPGLALTCRDFTQEALGRRWSVAAILVGAAFSWLISPGVRAGPGYSVPGERTGRLRGLPAAP